MYLYITCELKVLIKTSKEMIKDEVKIQGYNAYSCQNIGIDECYFYI